MAQPDPNQPGKPRVPDDPGLDLLDAPEMDAAVLAYAAALGPRARKTILAGIQGKDKRITPSRRMRAIDMLGALNLSGAGKRLMTLLRDRDRQVRLHAICALGRVGGQDAVERLLIGLDDKRHAETEKAHILRVLGEIGDLGTAQRLEAWGSRGRPFALRLVAQRAVKAIRDAYEPQNQPQLPYQT